MEDLIEGFVLALDPIALLITIAGVAVGVIVGAIPGLSGAMLIALLLPVTFQRSHSMRLSPSSASMSAACPAG